ncbi:hypothetical protein [Methanoregula sp.]|uniref:hypothetical protein n=1 Tax=Methanoregula sp. TaxID=2052170 RepID=UPI00356A30A5
MTSRRCTLIEEGARELLQLNGYTVQVVPHGVNTRYPPVHLIATGPSGEVRLIRIRKIFHREVTPDTVSMDYPKDIAGLRNHLLRHSGMPENSYELWIYSVAYGFRCFEILSESVRKIQNLSWKGTVISRTNGAV